MGNITSDISEVSVRSPLIARTVLKQIVLVLLQVILDVFVTDNKLVVGEVLVQIVALVTAASENGVYQEDRDPRNHEDGVHEGAH